MREVLYAIKANSTMPLESNENQKLFLDCNNILHVFPANRTRVRLIRDWSEIEMDLPTPPPPAPGAEDGLELLKGLHGKQPASTPQAQNKGK